MEKRNSKEKFTFDFDEQGTNEVSEQIMNAYNSGFIQYDSNQEAKSAEFGSTEG